MTIIQQSYTRLFPFKPFPYQTSLEYNRRLSPFNANIKLSKNTLSLHLNLQWKDIDDEIKIGLIQSLLLKILKTKSHTPNIDLYNNFIKNIPLLTENPKSHPLLEASFQRNNTQFFQNQLEQPNLLWGAQSLRKLAHYNFHNDTIVMSTAFQTAPQEMLDYIMYHEMLHKHLQFHQHNGRHSYHSPQFKHAENLYPNKAQIEQQIQQLIRTQKRTSTKTPSFWQVLLG